LSFRHIPEKGNRSELVLTVLHSNKLGLDEFLGQVSLPLNEMDVYESPRSRWHKLESKPGKESKKDRGELEVRIGFEVRPGSLTELNKKEKNKSSISNLMGGSLLSLGTLEKRKGLKKFAKSMGSKMHITSKKKKDKIADTDSVNSGSFSSIGTPGLGRHSQQTFGDADPGVISEDEDEFVFDNLSHKSSGSSLHTSRGQVVHQSPQHLPPLPATPPPAQHQTTQDADNRSLKSMTLPPAPSKPPRTAEMVALANETYTPPPQVKEKPKDEWETKLYGKQHGSTDSLKRRSWEPSRVVVPLAVANDVDSEHPLPEHYNNKSVPTTPNLGNIVEEQHRVELRKKEPVVEDRPKPLPRQPTNNFNDNFIENEKKVTTPATTGTKFNESAKIAEVKPSKHEKSEKHEKDNIFTKKLKMFRKDKSDSMEDIKLARTARQQFNSGERIIIGDDLNNGHIGRTAEVSPEILQRYEGKSREEVIKIAHNLESDMHIQKARVKELEDYLDTLLLKVMETHPKILQNPYSKAGITKRLVLIFGE
jgi:Rab11 family-interacting protein 1/2/5